MRPTVRRLALLCLWSAACAATAAEPTPVTVAPLAGLVVLPTRDAPATVVSLNDTVVPAEVPGRVTEVLVRVGDRVEAGAPLARIDCADHALERDRAQAALAGVEARLSFARFQLERARALAPDRNVSQETLNQREAEQKATSAERVQATASVALAERTVAKCTVAAPFPALVTERLASQGTWRSPGEPVARLLDLVRVEVSAHVDATAAESLRQAGSLVFSDGTEYPLALRALLEAVDSRARTREARLEFRGPPALPGSPGRLLWRSAVPHVPASLLVRRGGTVGVFTVEGQRAAFVPLPGAMEGRPAPVDLALETLLVVDGRYGLVDGAPVTVAEGPP